jgi:hypothetical protein
MGKVNPINNNTQETTTHKSVVSSPHVGVTNTARPAFFTVSSMKESAFFLKKILG